MIAKSDYMDSLWYKDKQRLKLGDVCRYRIRYTSRDPTLTEIYVRVKNMEKTTLRAIHLLNGPFVLYCHVVPCRYNYHQAFAADNAALNREVCFRNSIKPGQTFNVKLYLNDNSTLEKHADGSTTHEWACDVVSQIVLNRKTSVLFVFMVGDDIAGMRKLNRSALTSISKGDFSFAPANGEWDADWGQVKHPALAVDRKTTEEIWNSTPRYPDRPVHLVIATHGIFSNLTADLLYLRDMLTAIDRENIVVEGFRDNAGRTEKGIHWLGVNVSTYVTSFIDKFKSRGYTIGSISFVGHSLGGPVQLYALKHILAVKGADYFEREGIALKNFVCLASPMLGVLSEMSLLILWFLDLGTLGKTGRDLTLLKKLPQVRRRDTTLKRDRFRPVLETLPDEPVQTLLRQFELRVVYANAINDGIVPLRTSAILYLDWDALGDVKTVQHDHNTSAVHSTASAAHSTASVETNESAQDIGQIPEEADANAMEKFSSFLANSFTVDNDSWRPLQRSMKSRVKRYAKISAKGTDLGDEVSDNADTLYSELVEDESGTLNIPPKASVVESAINSLLCPIPSLDYLTKPDTRKPVIFHDKYYNFNSIPKEERRTGGFMKFFHFHDWRMDKQVKIARKYHAPDLNWRKVLVCLPPDAHNNIVVRRRFANGYGWGVIDHLTEEVFQEKKIKAKI